MGTVADKFSYLAGTKAAIKTAIEDKGVTVTEQDTFRSYATKIADISGGSSPAEWSWPDGWPDIQSIVENDTDNTYPYKCIWLLNNDCIDFDYSFGGNVEKVLTSDGITYTDDFIHTWDALQDVGEYRYLILYMSGDWTTQKDSRPISITYNSAFLSGQTSFYSMFYGCHSLQTIPQLDTSGGTNFSQMFYQCYSLQSIPLLDTSSGTDFGNMFYSCRSLQSIPLLDTSSGTDFSQMFYQCYSLQTIPLMDTSNGTDFSQIFAYCYSLQSIPLLDTSSGTSFIQIAKYCYSLQSMPQLDTSSGTDFSEMFNSCYSLQSVSPLDTSSSLSFSNMFYNCYSLQYIDASQPTYHIYNYHIDFSSSPYLSKVSILNIFNNLPTTTGQIIKIDTALNTKLSTADKEIATNKGWTVAVS